MFFEYASLAGLGENMMAGLVDAYDALLRHAGGLIDVIVEHPVISVVVVLVFAALMRLSRVR